MAIAVSASGRWAKEAILAVHYFTIEQLNARNFRSKLLVVGLVVSRLCLGDKKLSMNERLVHLIGDTATSLFCEMRALRQCSH